MWGLCFRSCYNYISIGIIVIIIPFYVLPLEQGCWKGTSRPASLPPSPAQRRLRGAVITQVQALSTRLQRWKGWALWPRQYRELWVLSSPPSFLVFLETQGWLGSCLTSVTLNQRTGNQCTWTWEPQLLLRKSFAPQYTRVSRRQKDKQERGTVGDSDSRAGRGRQPWGLGLVPLMRSGNAPS